MLFQARLYEMLAEAICEGRPVLRPNMGCAGEALAKALMREVKRRPTAEALVRVLRSGEIDFDFYFFGYDDLVQRIVDYVADEFKKDQGIDLREDRSALRRLTDAAEKANIELSTILETEINLPFISADASGPKHLQVKITKARLGT